MNIKELILSRVKDIRQEHVFDAEQATREYGKTTFSHDVEVDAAVKVTSREQIKSLFTLANENQLTLYPISTGNNWGYASFSGDSDHAKVVLDLSPMNKIYPTNKTLGLITVEPGVTQKMLSDYLEENDWQCMTPVTGAGPNCGILSNALERGYGITPKTEHFDAVTALKAILPHPELCQQELSSAISELDSSDNDFIDKTFKYGIGPYIDGLFTQSNMGIVTECTIRLAKKPEKFCAFYIRCYEKEKLPQLVELIRKILRDFEGIVGSINLMDKRRLISMTAANPNGPDAHQAMSEQQVHSLAKELDTPEWLILGSIYGSQEIVNAVKKVINRWSSGLGKVLFSDSALLKTAKVVCGLPVVRSMPVIEKISQQLVSLDEGLEIMLGKPNQIALPLAYWRNPNVTPDKTNTLLPSNDECGLLWYAPLIPMDADKISEFVDFVRATTPNFGIEPLITFTNLRHDCIDSTVPIVFNKTDEECVRQAFECIDTLVKEGLSKGYVPYRMNTRQQKTMLNKETGFWQTVDKLKLAIDPNRVLNPDRYNPH